MCRFVSPLPIVITVDRVLRLLHLLLLLLCFVSLLCRRLVFKLFSSAQLESSMLENAQTMAANTAALEARMTALAAKVDATRR